MEDKSYKSFAIIALLILLLVLSYFVLKPFLMAVLFGIFLAFIFTPLYKRIHKRIKSKNLATSIVCVILAILILVPLWFLTPLLITQSINIFLSAQQMDFVTPLKEILPSVFSSEQFSAEIASTISSFISRVANNATNIISDLILNFPTLALQFIVAIFVFFFVLRDGDRLILYLQSILPFPKEVEKKLFKSSNDITFSILYGQVLLGIVQGLIAGIAFFAFGIKNALFLTILAAIAGIFPIIGTAIIWVPVALFLLISGDTFAMIGVIFFGVLSSLLENFVKPIFVSKRTKVHSAIILVGMVGGLFLFGFLGVILGPLILAYLLILLDLFRDKRLPGFIIEDSSKK
ncbi:MAG: AI-2E family transporter [Nanoarchaeota archaeon]|nr:AI-2E family transporter [Nanoarchaeota archaeon]